MRPPAKLEGQKSEFKKSAKKAKGKALRSDPAARALASSQANIYKTNATDLVAFQKWCKQNNYLLTPVKATDNNTKQLTAAKVFVPEVKRKKSEENKESLSEEQNKDEVSTWLYFELSKKPSDK